MEGSITQIMDLLISQEIGIDGHEETINIGTKMIYIRTKDRYFFAKIRYDLEGFRSLIYYYNLMTIDNSMYIIPVFPIYFVSKN